MSYRVIFTPEAEEQLAVLYGYIVERSGSYDAPFIPMVALLLIGALLWARVDASKELGGAYTAPWPQHSPL